jgi:hypothetical protein
MEEVKIYALVCPLSLKIKYIGRTKVSLPMRLSQHVFHAKNFRDNTHKSNWIRSLLKINSRPYIRKLCVVKGWSESYEVERNLIAKYQSRLLNHNDRGSGNNAPKSNEHRQKLSDFMKKTYTLKGKALHEKTVYVYDLKGNLLSSYDSSKKAAANLGIYHKSISKALSGICKQIKGYQFSRFIEKMPDLTTDARIMGKRKNQ